MSKLKTTFVEKAGEILSIEDDLGNEYEIESADGEYTVYHFDHTGKVSTCSPPVYFKSLALAKAYVLALVNHH